MDAPSEVVVGVDGSEPSLRALEVAAREARLRGGSLTAVWAWGHRDPPSPPWGERFDPEDERAWAQQRFEELLAEAAPDPGAGGLTARALPEDPAAALVDAGRGAALVVVGARGQGGFLGLRLGSVSQRLLGRAPCPVLVIPGGDDGRAVADAPEQGRIVVGVDGSDHAREALRWALHEARLRGVPVVAVHGWTAPTVLTGPGPVDDPWAADAEREAAELLQREVAWAGEEDPEVRVDVLARNASGAAALIEASEGAGLAVVGSRGRGALAGLVLGSASQQVVTHAACPVVVVPSG